MLKRAIIGAALCAALSTPAFANCAKRDLVVERLEGKYQERQQVIGLSSGDNLFEVFVNTETGTWTAMTTSANGVTCIGATGTDFELIPQTAPAVPGSAL